jgi:hypothetical protein
MRSLHLTHRDITVFEKLADRNLDTHLKCYLLDFYRKSGKIDQVATQQAEAAKECGENCNGCSYCQPFCQDTLLDQLLVVCEAWNLGIFDSTCDNYETAKTKLTVFKEAERLLLPF